MAEVSVTIQIKHNTTKSDLVAELERLNIPDTAKLRVNYYDGDPREPSFTNLIWSWHA